MKVERHDWLCLLKAKESMKTDPTAEPPHLKENQWNSLLATSHHRGVFRTEVSSRHYLCHYEQASQQKSTREISPPQAISNPYPQTVCAEDAGEK